MDRQGANWVMAQFDAPTPDGPHCLDLGAHVAASVSAAGVDTERYNCLRTKSSTSFPLNRPFSSRRCASARMVGMCSATSRKASNSALRMNCALAGGNKQRSEEHTSELQSLR